MNLETLDWDQELLDIFRVSRSSLPTIKSSSEVYAHTDPHGPFGTAIPIAGILGDQQAAMVGQVCFERGESKTTYGTGNFALLNTGTEIVRSKNGLLTTLCFKFGDQPAHYALEGSVAVTGSAIQWLRDQLGIITNAAETENLASSVTDTAGVYFVPAFSGLFAPYWRSDARGAIVGLTRAATKAHLARAALEAICYQTRDVMDAMVADSGVPMREMRVDGGITANSLCMQMQADIMGIDITR
jgi:glycerol kinase